MYRVFMTAYFHGLFNCYVSNSTLSILDEQLRQSSYLGAIAKIYVNPPTQLTISKVVVCVMVPHPHLKVWYQIFLMFSEI